MSCYSFLGHLTQLETQGRLKDLQEISGASAGALTGFTFLVGRSNLDKLVNYSLVDVDFTKCLKVDIVNLLKKYGMFKAKPIRKSLSDFCLEFTGKDDITFKELYESSNVKLHIPAFSLLKHECEYFSVDTSPHMSVIDAVCMSIAIPVLFEPYKDHLDGAITEAIPYTPFIQCNKDDVYVVRTTKTDLTGYDSLLSFIHYIFSIFWKLRIECPIPYNTFYVPIPAEARNNYKVSIMEKEKLFLLGFQ